MKKTSDVMRARNLEIYQRRKSGESYQSIAAMFGLSRTWVIKICYRERKLEYQPNRQEEERPLSWNFSQLVKRKKDHNDLKTQTCICCLSGIILSFDPPGKHQPYRYRLIIAFTGSG